MNKTKTKEDNNPRISPTLIEIIKWDVIERKGQKILLTRFRDNKFTIIRPDEKGMVEEEYAAEKNGALKLLKIANQSKVDVEQALQNTLDEYEKRMPP